MFSTELELVPDSDRFYQTLTDIIVCMYIIAYLSSPKKARRTALLRATASPMVWKDLSSRILFDMMMCHSLNTSVHHGPYAGACKRWFQAHSRCAGGILHRAQSATWKIHRDQICDNNRNGSYLCWHILMGTYAHFQECFCKRGHGKGCGKCRFHKSAG